MDFGRKYHGVATLTSGGFQGSVQAGGGNRGRTYAANNMQAAKEMDQTT
jgi:hypothetical protein